MIQEARRTVSGPRDGGGDEMLIEASQLPGCEHRVFGFVFGTVESAWILSVSRKMSL